jgi:hypothetical protein
MSSASMPRKVGQLLPWLPLLVPIAGAILIIWSMVVTLTTIYVNATYPYFGTGPTESHPLAVPVFPANQNGLPKSDLPLLFIGVNSIDLVSRSVSVRLDLEMPNAIVTRLRMVTGTRPVPVPLTAVPRRLWAQIPLKIELGPCGIGSTPADFAATVQNCGGPTVTVPLGQVINFAGRPGLLDRLISIPAYGAPTLFPSDRYTVPTSPVVLLESPVFLDTGQGNHPYDKYYLPPVVIMGTTSDVVNYYADESPAYGNWRGHQSPHRH